MQLLWINLITDSLPAIALGMEPVEKDVMNQKPKPKTEGLFAHGLGVKIILQGFMFGALSIVAYKIGEYVSGGNESIAQTMAFMVLALSQTIHAYNVRSDHSLFSIGFFTNKTLNLATIVSLGLMAIVLFTPVGIAFNVTNLFTTSYAYLYLIALGLVVVPLIVMEVYKLIVFIIRKSKEKKID